MARPQKIGIPPGGLAGQALIKSSDNDFEVTWGGPTNGGGGGNNGGGGTIANGFLGRPYAVWSGSGLIFNVYWPVYYIQGVQYASGATTITLDAADATNDRIDVIAVDSTGGIKITGTPAASPVKPTVDALTQLEITTISIAATATTPTGITDESVYKENVEWTGSSNVSGADFDDTTDPFAGTKDVSIGSFTNGQFVKFVDGSTHDISDYTYLKFYVRLKAQFLSNTGFVVTFWNGTTRVSSAFTIINGIYSFSRTDTSGYQLVVIPLSEFTFQSATFDTVNFQLRGNNTSGFYFDNIILQGGIIAQTSLQNAITTIQTPSGAAVSDQPNDTFVFVGSGISASGKTITFTGGGGGSGTINTGNQYRLPYYSANPTGTTLSEAAAITAARILKSDANGVPTHTAYTEDDLTNALTTWRPLPTITRVSGTQFTIPDVGNAGNWDKKLDRLRVIKWLDTTVHVGIVISSSYSSDVVTVNIAGDTLDSSFTNTSGFYTIVPPKVVTFAYAGNLSANNDLARNFNSKNNYRVLMADGSHGIAGTTNATTYELVKNATANSLWTTDISIASGAKVGNGYTAIDGASLTIDDEVTLNCNSVSTTPPVDVYIDMYLFETNNIYL